MDRKKFEIKAFHFFNTITWFLAFALFDLTQRAKPQDIDMFNYWIRFELSREWNLDMIKYGKWLLLILCILCIMSFLSNIVMSIDTKKKFSKSQLIITLFTIWLTYFYFTNFGFQNVRGYVCNEYFVIHNNFSFNYHLILLNILISIDSSITSQFKQLCPSIRTFRSM